MKRKMVDPYNLYLGNIFKITNGIGEVSELKYVIIPKKEHLFAKKKYYAFPGEEEVLVGNYILSIKDEGIPLLINATRLHKIVGYKKIDAKKIVEIITENNEPELLEKHIKKSMI